MKRMVKKKGWMDGEVVFFLSFFRSAGGSAGAGRFFAFFLVLVLERHGVSVCGRVSVRVRGACDVAGYRKKKTFTLSSHTLPRAKRKSHAHTLTHTHQAYKFKMASAHALESLNKGGGRAVAAREGEGEWPPALPDSERAPSSLSILYPSASSLSSISPVPPPARPPRRARSISLSLSPSTPSCCRAAAG